MFLVSIFIFFMKKKKIDFKKSKNLKSGLKMGIKLKTTNSILKNITKIKSRNYKTREQWI